MADEVVWLKPTSMVLRTIPIELQSWLLDRGSLTSRLVAASGGNFRVQVNKQGWDLPDPAERHLLNLPDRRFALIREVTLLGHGVPWVNARTVIPPRALKGRYRRLKYLNNRPLGETLHRDQLVRHGLLEVARLDNPGTWARRRVYFIHDKPILVSEVLIPEAEGSPWANSLRRLTPPDPSTR